MLAASLAELPRQKNGQYSGQKIGGVEGLAKIHRVSEVSEGSRCCSTPRVVRMVTTSFSAEGELRNSRLLSRGRPVLRNLEPLEM